MIPHWLHHLSSISLALGALCAIVIAIDELRRPQHMWVMNIVWPVTALFGSLFSAWGYFKYGVLATKRAMREAQENGDEMPNKDTPFPAMVGKGSAHCGCGCTLGDICAEWMAFYFPAIATWLGWRTVFAEKIFAVWIFDFILAFGLGVAFQYFTIKPMRNLSVK